jgi:hypothetical protein
MNADRDPESGQSVGDESSGLHRFPDRFARRELITGTPKFLESEQYEENDRRNAEELASGGHG